MANQNPPHFRKVAKAGIACSGGGGDFVHWGSWPQLRPNPKWHVWAMCDGGPTPSTGGGGGKLLGSWICACRTHANSQNAAFSCFLLVRKFILRNYTLKDDTHGEGRSDGNSGEQNEAPLHGEGGDRKACRAATQNTHLPHHHTPNKVPVKPGGKKSNLTGELTTLAKTMNFESHADGWCRGFRTQNSLVVCTRTPRTGRRRYPLE